MGEHTSGPVNHCSFCGRSEEQTKKLIAGANAFICDQCVVLCSEVLATDGKNTPAADRAREAVRKPGSRQGNAGWTGYDPAPRDAS
jgi:ATP-dependent Clp protease ATP-binding subunit ClpX